MQALSESVWILSRKQRVSWDEFVAHWKAMYNYSSKNESYDTYVLNRPVAFVFEADHIRELYRWKNNTGDRLAAPKAASVENKIVPHLEVIQQLYDRWDDSKFDTYFGGVSTVWQTYLMHIIQPARFPIFDQHVYRAYTYLQTGNAEELKGTTKRTLALYRQYQTFFDDIQGQSRCDPRDLDKALWAFGKFIKQYKPLLSC
jgi:hypothetical protein